jgi:hypothetical protein
MQSPIYHNPIHTGVAQAGAVSMRPTNGPFNPYLPAMEHGHSYGGWYANWRARRTAKRAAKWTGREQKWAEKTGGIMDAFPAAGGAYDPSMYPTQQAGMGAPSPGMAIGALLGFALLIGGVLYLTKEKE